LIRTLCVRNAKNGIDKSMVRHILTFKSTLPEVEEYDHPKGYAIVELLAEELARTGWEVNTPDNYRDIAWSLDCTINDKNIFFFAGYLGTKITDWQLIVCSGLGIIKRLLGKKDEDERILLAQAIHAILSNDNRFSDLKWFSRYTDSAKDEWYPEPT
jgi:hypothetical protein